MTLAKRPPSLFDRVAIAVGAAIIGCVTAFAAALPLLFLIGTLFHVDLTTTGAWLFWKAPLVFGLVCGVVGFASPTLLANWFGNAWKAVIGIWRSFYGG